MKARVTITLDPETHRLAKRRARSKRTTVSGLIQSLLTEETAPVKHSVTSSLIGSASLKNPPSGTDPLFDALKTKYAR